MTWGLKDSVVHRLERLGHWVIHRMMDHTISDPKAWPMWSARG